MGCCSLWHAAQGAQGREQTLTLARPCIDVPWGLQFILSSTAQFCEAHHRAGTGAMLFLVGCCHTDMGGILKGFGEAGKGSPDLKCWLCMPAVLFPLRAGSGTPALAATSHRSSWWQPGESRHMVQGHLGRGTGHGPQSQILMCMHPCPQPAPRCVHSRTPIACTGGVGSGLSTPTPSLQ